MIKKLNSTQYAAFFFMLSIEAGVGFEKKMLFILRQKLLAFLVHFVSSVLRASKNISGLVKVTVTSPAGLNVEP